MQGSHAGGSSALVRSSAVTQSSRRQPPSLTAQLQTPPAHFPHTDLLGWPADGLRRHAQDAAADARGRPHAGLGAGLLRRLRRQASRGRRSSGSSSAATGSRQHKRCAVTGGALTASSAAACTEKLAHLPAQAKSHLRAERTARFKLSCAVLSRGCLPLMKSLHLTQPTHFLHLHVAAAGARATTG